MAAAMDVDDEIPSSAGCCEKGPKKRFEVKKVKELSGKVSM